MRIDKVKIRQYKNLRDFDIDFDEKFRETVLLGRNASGKSNFMEALLVIFRNVDLNKDPEFDFEIKYFIRKHEVIILARNKKYSFQVDQIQVSRAVFQRRKAELFPKYVFAYYSGVSNRLEEHFDEHQKRFYDAIELLR